MSAQAHRIRERRKSLGISQKALGEAIGILQGQISKFEHGESIPSSEVLGQLAQILGVSADWLLGLTEDSTQGQEEH
jgi:transcriptional regulator with XRE-family HTH domain